MSVYVAQVILHQLVLDAALLCREKTPDTPDTPEAPETPESLSRWVNGTGDATTTREGGGAVSMGQGIHANADLLSDWKIHIHALDADVCWAEESRDMYLEEAVGKLLTLTKQWTASLRRRYRLTSSSSSSNAKNGGHSGAGGHNNGNGNGSGNSNSNSNSIGHVGGGGVHSNGGLLPGNGTVFTNTASEAMVAISTVKADEPVYSPSNNDLWRERFGGSIGDTPSRGGNGGNGGNGAKGASAATLGTSSLASLGTVGPPNLGKKREK